VRENLFNTWYNGILTIICLVVIVQVLISVISWIFGAAQWTNPDKLAAVLCWSVSPELYWRLWTTLIIAGVAALSWGNVTKQNSPVEPFWLDALGVTVALVVFLPIALTARLWLLAIIIISMVGYLLGQQLDATPVAGCP